MDTERFNIQDLLDELTYATSRSGGKGGQHANKTETRVQVFFDVKASRVLTEEQKDRLLARGKSYMSDDGVLQMASDSARSQSANKEEAREKLLDFVKNALKPKKKRKKTRVPRNEKKKRLKNKRKHAEKKQTRKPPDIPDA
ncbi:MAG: alternative ribosome rescue aminoacyl-tRNA hydrolase ArfB [Bacteroidota bacterium]